MNGREAGGAVEAGEAGPDRACSGKLSGNSIPARLVAIHRRPCGLRSRPGNQGRSLTHILACTLVPSLEPPAT